MDIAQQQYVGLELYDLPKKEAEAQKLLTELLNDSLWLTRQHSSQSAAYVNTYNTVVPIAVFQEKDKEAYFSMSISENDLVISHQSIPSIGLQCIYGAEQSYSKLIKTHFPAIKEFHHSGTLLNALAKGNLFTQDFSVLVNIHDELFDIIVSKDKSLYLLNTYSYKNKEDYLFFLLNTCEQLKLDLEQLPVTIYGRVEKASQLIDITNKYIPKVQFGKRPDKFKYSYKFSDLPEHFFFNLFNQYFCV